MKRVFRTLLICILSISSYTLFADDNLIVLQKVLFDRTDGAPLQIVSNREWTDISVVDMQELGNLPELEDGYTRKWRLAATYTDENGSGQSMLQVRLQNSRPEAAVFTFPWSDSNNSWQDNLSGWYTPEDDYNLFQSDLMGVCSVRLISPPRTETPGRVYQITLEIWDFKESIRDVQLARAPSLRIIEPEEEVLMQITEDEAKDFALNFVKICMESDTPAFYRSLNDTVYSLHNGDGRSKYQVSPPESVSYGYNLADYELRYKTKMYSYNEYIQLFPEWADESRPWTPDENSWLFMGQETADGSPGFIHGDFLVFMVSYIDGDWKIIARPQH